VGSNPTFGTSCGISARLRASTRRGMKTLRSRPALASTGGGIVFAALLFVIGRGDGLPGMGFALVLGAVFALSMFGAMRRRGSRRT
jgi:peptidoglycan/LPS O-acetylase OafA/YrhL